MCGACCKRATGRFGSDARLQAPAEGSAQRFLNARWRARLLPGALRRVLLARPRKLASQASNAGSNPAHDATSLPADPAPALRTQVAKVRLLPGTPCSRRGNGAAPPKRGSAVRLCTGALRGPSDGTARWAHNPIRKGTRFNSGPRYRHDVRNDRAFIRRRDAVRVRTWRRH